MTTFQEALRTLRPEQLRELIRLRPDAFYPTPPSWGSLGTRLSLAGSASRALRCLNAAELRLLESLGDAGAELSPVDASELPAARVPGAVERLRAFALVFGPLSGLRVAPGVLSALPAGWRLGDQAPDDLNELLDGLSSRERSVLDTLAASGSVGTTRAAAPDADPTTPVATLLSKGLLLRVDASTVRLPRPVRDVLRGLPPRQFPEHAPVVDEPDQPAIDRSATGAGLDAVRKLRQLLLRLLRAPVVLNKDGSVGVRAHAGLTQALGFDPALLITVGESAGLVGRGSTEDADVLAATHDALSWLDATLADQWAILLVGWLASPWRTDKTPEHRLLSEPTHNPDVRHARKRIVEFAGPEHEARLLFHAPLMAANFSPQLIDATIAEAASVGAIGGVGSSASTPLLTLLDGGDVVEATKQLVPAEVSELIAQGDMTLLAPGPLDAATAAVVEDIADLESPGLASMWRISDASLKRAFDRGHDADSLHTWFEQHIMGEVPQAITFLIDDLSRTHGAIRAGSALSYIRSTDPSLITVAAEHAALRILAPTVAVSAVPLPQLLHELQAAGLQPTAEDDHGATITIADDPTLVRATPSSLPRTATPNEDDVEKIVEALSADRSKPSIVSETSTTDMLRAAARGRRRVRVDYADAHGVQHTLTVIPLTVNVGVVDAQDTATQRVLRMPLRRVISVTLL